MNAKKLPTILDLMIEKSRTLGIQEPIYECRMGWCTQCSCKKEDVVAVFGDVAYRSNPTIPPVEGKVLPCIMTQVKLSLSIDELSEITLNRKDVIIQRNISVLARLPSQTEIGSKLKTLIFNAGRVVVGSRQVISDNDVIVRNPQSLDGVHFTDMLVNKETFMKTYGKNVTVEFSVFSKSVPIQGVRLTTNDLLHWPVDADGKRYYEKSGERFEVSSGTVITENGNAITDDMMRRLIITPKHAVRLDAEQVVEPGASTISHHSI